MPVIITTEAGVYLTTEAGGTAPVPGDDLYQAIIRACHDDDDLTEAFGKGAFAWISAGRDSPLPYAVVEPGPRLPVSDPVRTRGTREVALGGTFVVTTYAANRRTALTLGRAIARTIEAASVAGELANDECRVIDVERTGNEGGELDPDPAPDGADVWLYRVEYRYLIHED